MRLNSSRIPAAGTAGIWPRSIRLFYPGLILATLLISLWTWKLAGFTFPVPWDDEAVFYYPAEAVAQNWQIQTDSLNPDRAVFYHPPGYPVALGLFLKLTQPSLGAARLFSWLCMAGAYLLGLALFRKMSCRLHASLVWSWFFLSSPMTIAGNIARPEALVFLLILGGYVLLLNHRPWPGAAVMVAACLIHPAAWILAAPAPVAWAWEHGRHWPSIHKPDIPWILVAGACAVAMASYLATRWNMVWNDLQVGIHFMPHTWAQRIGNLKQFPQAFWAILALLLPVICSRQRPPLPTLSLMALAFWFPQFYRPEMWYETYTTLLYVLAAIILIEIALRHSPDRLKHIAGSTTTATLLLALHFQGHLSPLQRFPYHVRWRHMWIRTRPDYIQPADIDMISKALEKHPPSPNGHLVQFYPAGDGPLFAGRLPPGWKPFYPSFTRHEPTASVFRLSRLTYPGSNSTQIDIMNRIGVRLEHPTRLRDDTEMWYVHFPGDSSPPPP